MQLEIKQPSNMIVAASLGHQGSFQVIVDHFGVVEALWILQDREILNNVIRHCVSGVFLLCCGDLLGHVREGGRVQGWELEC